MTPSAHRVSAATATLASEPGLSNNSRSSDRFGRFARWGLVAALVGTFAAVGCQPGGSNKSGEDKSSSQSTGSADSASLPRLSDDQRLKVWKSEQLAFEIESRFGPVFKHALRSKDVDYFKVILFAGAEVQVTMGEPVVAEHAGVEQSLRSSASPADNEILSPTQWVDLLLASFDDTARIEEISLKVLSLAPSEQELDNWDVEIRIEVLGTDRDNQLRRRVWDQSVTFVGPADEDLEKSVSLSSWLVHRRLDSTRPKPFFTEVTDQSQLPREGIPDNWLEGKHDVAQYRYQMAIEDFDLDGLPDVAIAPFDGPPVLLRQYPDGTLRESGDERGIGSARPLGNYCCCWIDFDNDRDPDLILGQQVYRNDEGLFVDVSDQAGLKFDPFCMGAIAADYDLDGDLDLYLLYQVDPGKPTIASQQWIGDSLSGKANRLWNNDGTGVFTDVTVESKAGGGARHSQAAAWFHLDDDLYPDLYIANEFGRNVLLKNQGDGSFVDVTSDYGLDRFSVSRGVVIGDVNNDGTNDIYVTSTYSDAGQRIASRLADADYPPGILQQIVAACSGNELLFRAAGQTAFASVDQDSPIADADWSFAPALVDIDNDGLLDLYVSNGFMSFEQSKPDGESCLFQAIAAAPHERNATLKPLGAIDEEFGQVWATNPIVIPIMKKNLGSYQRNSLFLNNGDLQFIDGSFASGANIGSDSRSAIPADFDRDGKADLLVNNVGGGVIRLFKNQSPDRSWVGLRLHGTQSNTLGVGARVVVHVGDQKIYRDLFPSSGFFGTCPSELLIGLGSAEMIDKLEIRWPSGEVTQLESVEPRRWLAITEGESEPKLLIPETTTPTADN